MYNGSVCVSVWWVCCLNCSLSPACVRATMIFVTLVPMLAPMIIGMASRTGAPATQQNNAEHSIPVHIHSDSLYNFNTRCVQRDNTSNVYCVVRTFNTRHFRSRFFQLSYFKLYLKKLLKPALLHVTRTSNIIISNHVISMQVTSNHFTVHQTSLFETMFRQSKLQFDHCYLCTYLSLYNTYQFKRLTLLFLCNENMPFLIQYLCTYFVSLILMISFFKP